MRSSSRSCVSSTTLSLPACLPASAIMIQMILQFVSRADAPVCREGQKKLFGVATREQVQVACEVDADPPQVSFRWSLNNSFEVLAVASVMSSELRSVALYAPRTKFGYGQLACIAKNRVGVQRQPCLFDVVPAGPPQPLRNCRVSNESRDSLIVRCDAGDDGGLEQMFHMEVFHSGHGTLHANLSTTRSPTFHVQGLPMSTPFLLALYSANAKGRSHGLSLSASTLPLLNKGRFCCAFSALLLPHLPPHLISSGFRPSLSLTAITFDRIA